MTGFVKFCQKIISPFFYVNPKLVYSYVKKTQNSRYALILKETISKPSKKFILFLSKIRTKFVFRITELSNFYFKKGILIFFGQNMINPAIVQPSQQMKKRQQKLDPLPPSNLTILYPCPTLLTCYSCAQKKEIEI